MKILFIFINLVATQKEHKNVQGLLKVVVNAFITNLIILEKAIDKIKVI